ncbi:TraM recognition domain-containing protein [Isoptericola sp. NPDC019482]|uniref:type IV secretory system conjugative DNA transfer family protein n=1 Tax=Isoptericola sp. NPDC019482 TaxID=3154688 RepID=UPI003493A465
MTSTTRAPRAGVSTGTDVALAALAAGIVLAAVLRLAGTLAANLSDADPPAAGLGAGLGVLANPQDPAAALEAPGLQPDLYWAIAAGLLAAVAVIAVVAWRYLRPAPRPDDGFATRADVVKHASARALTKRATNLRPSLTHPRPEDVGYRLGQCHGKDIWASVEDSMLLVGPPRSGKGLYIVINAILDAPGAVVTTSTRPDALTITLTARQRRGPIAIFDPQHLAPDLPAGLRWSPVRGCEDPETAAVRARGLASASGFGAGTENGGYWEGLTREALKHLLHAAALGERTPADLHAWAQQPAAAADAVAILASAPLPHAAMWAHTLNAAINADPRTRDAVWSGLQLALASLSDPHVLDAVTPRPGEGFDPESFIRNHGTLYLLATATSSGTAAPLVAALVEDLTETAKRLAAHSPGARLDPPLLLALDEIGNLAPLPSLPQLMSEGGGSGITVLPVLQSISQARAAWGEQNTGTIWDAAIVKILLGGSSVTKDLHDLSTLIGDHDETTHSTTIGPDGTRTSQESLRRVPIMTPQQLRTMPFGTGLVLLRSIKPLQVRLRSWTKRNDAGELITEREAV